ncbi:MAG: LTA synthase family protein, partial [Erysipelotrichaceae bacterium]|nr:LTA synthase family protein [Erysipelotrichaceae bacterium]
MIELLFVSLYLFYAEALMMLIKGGINNIHSLVTILLVSFSIGSLITFLLSFTGKFKRILTFILLLLSSILFNIEFFINDTFQVYMNLPAIIHGGGGVATGFMDTVKEIVASGYGIILLFELPLFIYLIIITYKESRKLKQPDLKPLNQLLVIVPLCLLTLLYLLFANPSRKLLRQAYNFDSAVKTFGLQTALILDGFSSKDAVIVNQIPKQACKYVYVEKPVEYNVTDIDFASISEQVRNNTIVSINNYVSSLAPSNKNDMTGFFKDKNLIFLTAEAFSFACIDPHYTPTLYKMMTEGIYFKDHYQPTWGGSTSTGEFSNLFGIVPTSGVTSLYRVRNNNNHMNIVNQFKALGYTTYAFHDNDMTFYDRHITHPAIGFETYLAWGNGMEKGLTPQWPESDLEMIDFTFDIYKDDPHFFAYYMTVSGHSPYLLTDNAMSRKNYEIYEDSDHSYAVQCYLAANYELELAMRSLLEKLEASGLLEDTVIVISPDHYPYGLESSVAWGKEDGKISELFGYTVNDFFDRDRSTLIIYNPLLSDLDLEIDTPTYSLDIVPTLYNLFGLDYDSRLLVGRDVFSDSAPLVLWPNYSWI